MSRLTDRRERERENKGGGERVEGIESESVLRRGTSESGTRDKDVEGKNIW